MASVLMVGSVAFDSVETPHGKVDHALGGAASFASVAASSFAPVRVVAVVGDDFPAEHLEFFASRGIDTTGIQRAAGKTFHWAGRYEEQMNIRTTLATELNVGSSWRAYLYGAGFPAPRLHRVPPPGTSAAERDRKAGATQAPRSAADRPANAEGSAYRVSVCGRLVADHRAPIGPPAGRSAR